MYKLQQVYWLRVKTILNDTHNSIRDISKFYLNKIKDKDVDNIELFDVSYLLHQYPFLQIFFPKIEPKVNLKKTTNNLIISCLNIDGGAKDKLTQQHPYFYIN